MPQRPDNRPGGLSPFVVIGGAILGVLTILWVLLRIVSAAYFIFKVVVMVGALIAVGLAFMRSQNKKD